MYSGELYHDGRSHKYVAKVKTADGRFRYFYSQEEYNAYMKVKKQVDAEREEKRKQDYKDRVRKESAAKLREHAKKTGNYTVPKKKLETKTYKQLQRENWESGKATNARFAKKFKREEKAAATRKAILNDTRGWRQQAAKKGKAFIDSILQPDK